MQIGDDDERCCGGKRAVGISELVLSVAAALNSVPVTVCSHDGEIRTSYRHG